MYAVFDFETTKWSQTKSEKITFKFGIIQYYDENTLFREDTCFSIDEVLQSLLFIRDIHKKPFRVYAHNLDYDIKFLLTNLMKEYELYPIDNHSLLSLKVRKYIGMKKGKRQLKTLFEFRNSLALFPLKLAEIGKILANLKGDYMDYNSEFNLEYWEYCRQDCRVVHLALQSIIKIFNDLGMDLTVENINLTTPSIAYKLFFKMNSEYNYFDKKRRLKSSLVDIDTKIDEEFREFYFGGRNEVYSSKIYEHVYYLDINSEYPFTMIHNKFPIPPYQKGVGVFSQNNLPKNCFALKCWVDESNQEIPLIPEKIDGKNFYLARKKHTLLIIEEFELLISMQIPIEIEYIWLCSKWEHIFDYFKKIYEIRKELVKQRNKIEKLYKILILNATYGKFIERYIKAETKFYPISILDDSNEFLRLIKGAKSVNTIIMNEKTNEGYVRVDNESDSRRRGYTRTNSVIGMRITALARLLLYQYITQIKNEGYELIYSDTDSIVINVNEDLTRIKHLIDQNELGKLKIEFDGYNFMAISPKEYIYCEKVDEIGGMSIFTYIQKAKGISKGLLYDYCTSNVLVSRPAKYKECMARKIDFDMSITVQKEKRTWYDKRLVNKSGTTDVYHSIEELEEHKEKNEEILRHLVNKWHSMLAYVY